MANFYLDTEFHEYHKQPKVCCIKIGKPIPTIDLISIGIVAENGKTYYAISKDFNIKDAWNSYQLEDDYDVNGDLVKNVKKVYWLRENVLKPIFNELVEKQYPKRLINVHGVISYPFTLRNLTKLIKKYGKSNKRIADEIKEFVYYTGWEVDPPVHHYKLQQKLPINFYTYYGDYDWVVFAQLFGKMIDLPNNFPMYSKDLKQMLDEFVEKRKDKNGKIVFITDNGKLELDKISEHPNYPKQENEHNALDDALWNQKLHKFIKEL